LKVVIVVASVNELVNVPKILADETMASDCELVVIDEGESRVRARNVALLQGVDKEFYGPRERTDWFRKRFSERKWQSLQSVIPDRCHAETSFGFLVAFENGADVIVEIDDDVNQFKGEPMLTSHVWNLSDSEALRVNSPSRWYNTLDNLVLGTNFPIWPRGHPYSPDTRTEMPYSEMRDAGESVLNMGLWAGDPDLDAQTILEFGGLDGKSTVKSAGLKHRRILLDKGTYFALCSMNTAFRAKIVPGFYQLYMKQYGIDRFDDIWSGIFLKKITDHLGDNISLGAPLAFHDKRPRDVHKDVDAEMHGIAINETLWRIVDSLELDGKDYYQCYDSLVNGLEDRLDLFGDPLHNKFMRLQVEKQRLWLNVVDKIT